MSTSANNILSIPEGKPVNWNRIRYFKPSEFGSASDLIARETIVAIDQLSGGLKKINPKSYLAVSPVPGAVARDQPGSQHHSVGRKSTAVDLFPFGVSFGQIYYVAKTIPTIGGLGVYPDTVPRVMIHVDTRPRDGNGRIAQWMRKKDKRSDLGYDWTLLDNIGLIT